MVCSFISQLSKLRKQSAESVENTNEFDGAFKGYLHVERQVELELKDLLRHINVHQGKCLVLLCGSAGDGKSHLISYLKNMDKECLLENYEPYNDATESSEPNLTSIDTLAVKLQSFDDEHLGINDGKKMIIAINLGTLNNFIESEKGKKFSSLGEYVRNNGIFSEFGQGTGYKEGSVFQHVNFSDYQVFSLGSNGIETDFLEKLFEKVFRQSDENPFYHAYTNGCAECSNGQRCPVRHNYEFLMDHNRQKVVINKIVQAVIMDKTIVSTREVLNLIYDLIVHPDFEASKIAVNTLDITYLTSYLQWTTPMLLNKYDDVSPLLNAIKSHDILKIRDCEVDEKTICFHAAENIEKTFQDATEGTPYAILNEISSISKLGENNSDLKKCIYRFVVRLNEMNGLEMKNPQHLRLKDYVQYLYDQNSGNEKKLSELYKATKKAVLNWEGEFESDQICVDDTNDHYWILEQLDIRPSINKNASKISGSIQRFSPNLHLKFEKENGAQGEQAEIRMDFSLFELITDIKDGYRPTVQDKNRHTDFVSFVQQLIEFGNKNRRITLIPKDSSKNYKIIFEENDFGFEFKKVAK